MEYLDLLQCPVTHSGLKDKLTEGDRDIPVHGRLVSPSGDIFTVENEVACLMPEDDPALRQFWSAQEAALDRLDHLETDYENAFDADARQAHLAWEADLAAAIMSLEPVPEVVVDAACGHGAFLRRFLQVGEFDGILVAVDRSRPRLNWLRNRIAENFAEAAEFVRYVVADPRLMPFIEDGIDVFVASSGFSNVPRPSGLLSQLRTKLIEGGAVIGRFYWYEPDSPSYRIAERKGIEFRTRDETVSAFKAAGFRDVQIHISNSGPFGNPMDSLPVPGDSVDLAVVTAIR